MRRRVSITTLSLLALLIFPKESIAVEIAPRISDREIIERLTRLEEGQKYLETSLGAKIQANAEATLQLRNNMNEQFERVDTQFARVDTQFERIDAQFNRLFQSPSASSAPLPLLLPPRLALPCGIAERCSGPLRAK